MNTWDIFSVYIVDNFLSPAEAVRNLCLWFNTNYWVYRGIFRTPVRILLLKSGLLNASEAVLHVMLLLWLQMLWLVVDLTTIIPCLGVPLPLILLSCNVPRTVLLELLPMLQSTPSSLILEIHSIGCLLNITMYLKLLYYCTSSYWVVILNILKLDTHRCQANNVCCLISHTLPQQYISQLSNLEWFAWSCTFSHFLKIYLFAKAYPPWLLPFSWSFSVSLTSALSLVIQLWISAPNLSLDED